MNANASDAQPILDVFELTKRYGPTLAVDRVTFQVRPGEVLGLLGPNGAGKTSILETVEGLRQPDGGTIRIFGSATGSRTKEVRARIGVQLQANAMLPGLTVRELLALQASFYPHPLLVSEVLASIGLSSKAKARSDQLSGGQLQRLAVGLALIGDPDLVLLDEPTTGLDPAARRDLWQTLEVLRGRGRALLLTTHYMEEAEALCDRVAILDQGRLVAVGSVAELAAERGGERLIFETDPELEPDALSQLPGVEQVVLRDGLTTLLTGDARTTLLGLVRSTGGLPERLAIRRPTLEEIYLELTGRSFAPSSAG